MNNKTTNKATFRKVGKIQNLYRHAKTGTYYSLIKRSGKQFRRSLKTNDLQLAKQWKKIGSVQGTGADYKFTDNREALFNQLYYRVRVTE